MRAAYLEDSNEQLSSLALSNCIVEVVRTHGLTKQLNLILQPKPGVFLKMQDSSNDGLICST